MSPANIVRIQIKNILSLTDVEIVPGKITQIVGQNNQGKTSILKALGLAAKGSTDGSVVKNGTEAGEIIIDLSDETKIRRRIKSDGKQTATISRGAFETKQPQAYLDELFGATAFNPLAALDPKLRNDLIMQAEPVQITKHDLLERVGDVVEVLPLDYTKHAIKVLEDLYKFLYARRTEANRTAKEKAQRYELKFSELQPLPEKPLEKSEAERIKKLAEDLAAGHRKFLDECQKAVEDRANLRKDADAKLESASQLRAELEKMDADMEKQLEQVRQNFAQRRAITEGRIQEITSAISGIETAINAIAVDDTTATVKAISEQEAVALEMKSQIDAWATYAAIEKTHESVKELGQEADAAKAAADAIDAKVKLVSGPMKEEIMQSMVSSFPGLSYVGGEFLLDGIKVENLSSSRAIRLAVAIARKHAKKVPVICIDGAEAMDPETWAAFVDETRDDGFTYFVSKVGDPFMSGFDAGKGDTTTVVRMQEGQVLQ